MSARVNPTIVQVVLVALVVLGARHASAFCRTTACDPRDSAGCEIDADGCVVSGVPLHWPTMCVSFGVQAEGSPLRHIGFDTASTAIRAAFDAWGTAPCSNGPPAIEIVDLGAITCNQPEYNQTSPNANVWMFRDDGWPHADGIDSTIALTTVTYATETGEIYDADVEMNSSAADITVGDTSIAIDLQSIATHEAGHFLGLSHTRVAGATMLFSYAGRDTSPRTLEPDDIAGICSAYPPGRVAQANRCTPRHGFSATCAPVTSTCNVGAAGRSVPVPVSGIAAALMGLLLIGGRFRRRRSGTTAG